MQKPRLRLRTSFLAYLAFALTPSLASAQLLLAKDGFVEEDQLYYFDLDDESVTTIASPKFGQVARDDDNGILYFLKGYTGCSAELWRWPDGDPAPTPVGCLPALGSDALRDMTFGNGLLYIAEFNLCRSRIFVVDPANPAGASLLYDPLTSGEASAIAFDPASGLLLWHKYGNFCDNDGQVGVYAVDPFLLTEFLLAPGGPGGTNAASATVGDGKLWLGGRLLSRFYNLDLTTLTWDPDPPVNPVPAPAPSPIGGWYGMVWSPESAPSPGPGGPWRRLQGMLSGLTLP